MFLSILALSLCFGIIFCNTLVLQKGHLAGSQFLVLNNLNHIRDGFAENNLGRVQRSSSWVASGCSGVYLPTAQMGAHLVGSTTQQAAPRKLVFPPSGERCSGRKQKQKFRNHFVKYVCFLQTLQELRMLSIVTLNHQVTKIVMKSGSQLSEF